MSLANLNIDVTVNTGAATRGLKDVGTTAREQFDRSGAAVDDFRQEILNASSALDRAARSMGAGMEQAAQKIETASDRSQAAVQQIGAAAGDVNFDGLAERVSAAFGAAFGAAYAGTQTWVQKIEEFVVGKTKAIAIGLAITAVSAVAGAVYAAYKVITGTFNFVKGLFTGDSYKSDAIDRLIERNKEQIEGQTAAKKAAAEVDFKVTKATRESADELDRLGVKYKDANGKLLDHKTILQNVKATLEDYADGYDRVKAAEAIGVGSLDEVNKALEDHSAELAKARSRMDEYLLGIGPQGQAEISRYQKVMAEFNTELGYMSDGFKHAIADSIMPALTDLADFFKEGFPSVVTGFRAALGTITSLFYGLKMAADIGLEGVRAAVKVSGELIVGVASATIKVFKGDFTGAADDMKRAWELSGIAVGQALDQVAKDAEKNRDRMGMALGLDGLKGPAPDAPGKPGKKTFTPAPKPLAASPYQNYLDELNRMATKLEINEYASLRLKAAQLGEKEGVKDLTKAYEAINRVQRGDGQKVIDEYSTSLYKSANAFEFETSLIGKNVLEQELLIDAYRRRAQAEQIIDQAKRAGRPLDQQALDDLAAITQGTIKQSQAQIKARDDATRSFDVGVSSTLSSYVRNATDAAANVATLITGSFSRMEDALVSFAKTGKLNFKDLFSFMAEEFLRQQIRMATANVIKNGLPSLGTIFSTVGSFFGASTPGHANGLDYVPYNGYPAMLHEGEKVLTRQDAQASRSGSNGTAVSVGSGQVINIGQGVSRAEVAAAINAANKQSEARIQRGLRQGSFA